MRDNKELTLYSNPHPTAIIELKSKRVYRGWQNVFAILRNPNPDAISLIDIDDLKRENPKSKGSLPYWKDFWRLASAHPGAEALLLSTLETSDNIHDRDIHKIDTLSAGSNPNPAILERLFGASGPLSGKIADAAFSLSANPAGFHFLLIALEKHIMGSQASLNPCPAAGEWLGRNPKKVDFAALSENPAPWAVEMLRANPDKIDYNALAKNTNADALALIEKEKPYDAEFWRNLSSNPSPAAIEILRANPAKIYWNGVMANQCVEAMRLLAENFDRVVGSGSWAILQENPAIFEQLEKQPEIEHEDECENKDESENEEEEEEPFNTNTNTNKESIVTIDYYIDDEDSNGSNPPICTSDDWEDHEYCTNII
jgi:hypothetical protein